MLSDIIGLCVAFIEPYQLPLHEIRWTSFMT